MDLQGWYPLALSQDIAAGTSAGAMVMGQEIVVWRDSAGQAHVWEDRCPHRGMRLSFGFVRGDHIACLYHGWEYAAGGQCRLIPAHPRLEVPKSICATTYRMAEAGGMIWAGFGEAGAAPSLAEAQGLRSVYVDAAPDRVLEALPVAFDAPALTRAALTGAALTGAAPVVMLDTAQGRLGIGVQPVDVQRTALHLTLTGKGTPQARAALARAATLLRDRLETGAAA